MYILIYTHMYMYVCIYVCMFVCMYVYTHIHVHTPGKCSKNIEHHRPMDGGSGDTYTHVNMHTRTHTNKRRMSGLEYGVQ